MLAQKIVTKNARTELFYDVLEFITGIALVGFLWTHMLFVASIYLGPNAFNTLSHFLDHYYLSYIGIPLIIIIFLGHFVIAGRRIPNRIAEQKIVWRHAGMLRERDTWTWVFQAITGMAILIMASIHMWMVVSNMPFTAMKSATRITDFLWFYIILLILGEFHAGTGLYRQFVKWGWFNRHKVIYVIDVISILLILMGLGAAFVFLSLGVIPG